jgi:hypothetical protein
VGLARHQNRRLELQNEARIASAADAIRSRGWGYSNLCELGIVHPISGSPAARRLGRRGRDVTIRLFYYTNRSVFRNLRWIV